MEAPAGATSPAWAVPPITAVPDRVIASAATKRVALVVSLDMFPPLEMDKKRLRKSDNSKQWTNVDILLDSDVGTFGPNGLLRLISKP